MNNGRSFFGRNVLVSIYLFGALFLLIIFRRIKSPGFWVILVKLGIYGLCPRYRQDLVTFEQGKGFCWLAKVPGYLLSDKEARSKLKLFEGDHFLGPAHSAHKEIQEEGGGRFSHKEKFIYFSTSDNSDPRLNGRRYRIEQGL